MPRELFEAVQQVRQNTDELSQDVGELPHLSPHLTRKLHSRLSRVAEELEAMRLFALGKRRKRGE